MRFPTNIEGNLLDMLDCTYRRVKTTTKRAYLTGKVRHKQRFSQIP